MDNNNVVGDTSMDLDLNQVPVEPTNGPVGGLGSLLDELETAHDQIEERIRRLEAVTARARQRQRWRLLHNRHVTNSSSGGTLNSVPNEVKCGKRDSSHLAASDDSGGGGSFFDCNICLEMAFEPILTCCGHLFCWGCFFQLPYFSPERKECPVCRGEVSDSSVIPIYGNGKSAASAESDRGSINLPPRPQARRIESLRQRRVQLQRDGGRWRLRTRELSTVMPESATSLFSISSALDNAERLVDDLESFVNGQTLDSNVDDVAQSSSSSSQVRFRLPVDTDPNYSFYLENMWRRMG